MKFSDAFHLLRILVSVEQKPEHAIYKDESRFGFGGAWYTVRFQIRTFRVGWKVGGIDDVDVGNLFSALDIVEHQHPIVVQVDGVDEHVDNAAAEIFVQRIALCEAAQPGTHFGFREFN